MKKVYSVSLIFILSAISLISYGQISQGGSPLSFQNPSLIKSALIVNQMPNIDLNRLIAEDSVNDHFKDIPWRFGENIYVNYNLDNSGNWDILPGGDKLWRLGIHCQGAYSINLTFDNYHLPPGATLYVYNADKSQVIGAFTEFNNQNDRVFATTLVKGEEITIEYYEPANPEFHGELNLYRITHGYRDAYGYAKNFGTSGSCENNVFCPEAAGWEDQIKSVCMLVSGGSGFCTGALVNNTNEDGIPYILTANHCYSNPSSWVFWFNWQSPTCVNPSTSPPYNSLSGATLKARNAPSDFCLVEMNDIPPPDYAVYYAGWNREDVGADSGACVHHPDGDIKKISYSSNPFTSDTWSGTPPDSHWRVDWSDGVTEPGSSGSPMFDQNHRLIGQLHGGPSSCTATDKWDYYGKFAMSWEYGTTQETRLKEWLDPTNIGGNTLDGLDPNIVYPIINTNDATAITGLTATLNGSVNPKGLETTYHFEYGTNPLGLTGATPPVSAGSGTLAVNVNADITGLLNNTKYYFRLVGVYSGGSAAGLILNFMTADQPTFSVNPLSQIVPYPADSTHFTITSNIPWSVVSESSWVTVNPSSGIGNGTITATFTENTSFDQRVAAITVSATGMNPQVVTITQEGVPVVLLVTPPNRDVDAVTGNTDFTVTSNTDWTVISDVSWCTVTPSGSGNGTIAVTFTENADVTQRVANITASAVGVGSQTVTVTQAGATPTLAVTPPVRNVSYPAASTSFNVVSNTSWTAESDAPWCTVTASGNGNGTITADFTTNTLTTARTATISVTVATLAVQQVSVIQAKSSVGINDIAGNELQIYPNPSKGLFRIIMPSGDPGVLKVTVRDLTGVTILYKEFSGEKEYPVDLSFASTGCYTVMLQTENRLIVRKLVLIK
jgi:lysyl endopeptidase